MGTNVESCRALHSITDQIRRREMPLPLLLHYCYINRSIPGLTATPSVLSADDHVMIMQSRCIGASSHDSGRDKAREERRGERKTGRKL